MTGAAGSTRASNVAIQVVWVWSVYVTLMGIYWSAGGAGYPFGHDDPSAPDYMSILASMDSSAGGPAIAVTGVAGVALVWLLERRRPRSVHQRTAMILAGCGYPGVLVAVVVDSRALMLLPPLGLVPVKWVEADWPTLFQMTVPAAAAGFVLATVRMARDTADRSPAGLARAAARSGAWDRVGRIAVYVAMLCPLPYAIIRLCWSRGWPVGAPEPFVESILRTQPANVWIEPVLAGFALTGAALTYGLLAPWGRVFPGWVPVLGGRRVPLWLPFGLGGSAVIGIWAFGRGLLLGRLGVQIPGQLSEFQHWGMSIRWWDYWGVDGLGWVLFPLWAISLALALVGYYHRRRLLEGAVARDPGGDARLTALVVDTIGSHRSLSRPRATATYRATIEPAAASGRAVPPPARWATWCAHAVVWIILPTALWRLPFAFGFDMGMDDPEAPPWVWWALPYTVGLILAVEGLAYLTVGLVSPWGEVLPSWLPRVGGRPVRPRLAVGAAATGGLALSALWISDLVNWVWFGKHVAFTSAGWELLALAGLLTHVVWGPMLLAVTFDYWRRHRHSSPPRNPPQQDIAGGRPAPAPSQHQNGTRTTRRRPVGHPTLETPLDIV